MKSMEKTNSENVVEMKNAESVSDPITSVVPEFLFSVNGKQIIIRIKVIEGAEGYEVYRQEAPGKKYTVLLCQDLDQVKMRDFSCYL